jgi:hypothetical protein
MRTPTQRRFACALIAIACVASTTSATTTAAAAPAGVLLVELGVHVEPMGLVNGQVVSTRGSYDNETYFRQHAAYLRSLAAIVERHGGRITFQVQSPFTDSCVKFGDNVIGELRARGHEIALHFHEDAHLGRSADTLAVQRWIDVMQAQVDKIRALDVDRVRMWSGGNLYPHILEAAQAVGLDVMSDWKNPKTQTGDPRLQVTTPWRPGGSPNGTDLAAFVMNDPSGKIVYLPTGNIEPKAVHEEEIESSSDPATALQEYWTDGLSASLSSVASSPAATHVFHITLHPGELQSRGYGGETTLDTWLREEIDPLVVSGKVQWATYSQMADAYNTVSRGAAGARGALGAAGGLGAGALSGSGYMTFALNIHDWKHPDESADTLLKAIGIFRKYGVRGDFYLTAQMAEFYARYRPDVIEQLRSSGMAVSYHVRAPHPLYAGFGQRLAGLSDAQLEQTLRDYETYKLDLRTGDVIRSEPGGYALVAALVGKLPVTIGTPSDDARVRAAAERVYASLGARSTVLYHESGTKPDQPFEWHGDLLIRPSDFSVTRWSVNGGGEQFWWNMLGSRNAAAYDPVAYLQQKLGEWRDDRPPFVTSLIHENNFVRSGAEGWTLSFYRDTQKTTPLAPPFDLDAADPSTVRSPSDQARIWENYERLVAWAAARLTVVTSADIVALATAQ